MKSSLPFAQATRLLRLNLALALAAAGAAHAQTGPVTATIGTGTSAASTNVLLSTSTTTNKYARTASIYSAAELTAAGAVAGSIVSIAWFKGGVGEYPTTDAQLSVYMKSTAASTLAVNPVDWATEIVGATSVYTNTALALPTGTGFKTFTLTTPFAWNGISNLEVLVDWFRNSATTGDISWQYTAVGTTGIHATQVNSVAIPTVRFASNRPNVQFVINRTGLATRATQDAALVDLYPNPAHQSFSIAVPAELTTRPVAVSLLNLLGQQVQHQLLPANASGVQARLDVSHLAAGIYTLRLATGDVTINKRVVVE